MDQQVMELLAKIYQTQTEMKNELKDLRADQETIAQNVAQMATVIEHDVAQLLRLGVPIA